MGEGRRRMVGKAARDLGKSLAGDDVDQRHAVPDLTMTGKSLRHQ